MPLQLPNLDDLRWRDLIAEGRSLIPSFAEQWTNHNPSDPGITLIELLAYVSGTLMYQLNRITDGDVAQFLSLINGPEWKRDQGLLVNDSLSSAEMREISRVAVSADEKRRSIRSIMATTRAVTEEDFDSLVQSIRGVGRAKCLPRVNLENDDPTSRWLDAPGHVSVVVLPLHDALPTPGLLAQIRQALEPARLLTTRVHVVPPRYVTVGVRLAIVPIRNLHVDDALQNTIVNKIKVFLDPHAGWFDGKGWPSGRDLHISELYQLVAEIPEVDSVGPTKDSQGVSQDEITVAEPLSDRIVRDQYGRCQAAILRPDELFDAKVEARDITMARHLSES